MMNDFGMRKSVRRISLVVIRKTHREGAHLLRNTNTLQDKKWGQLVYTKETLSQLLGITGEVDHSYLETNIINPEQEHLK